MLTQKLLDLTASFGADWVNYVLIGVSIIDVLIGRWLWQGRPRGAVLALVMAPVSFALGWLFALPYLIVMAPLRAIGAIVAWPDLRR